MPANNSETSLFERIGGADTVSQLVDRFYALMDQLPPARTIRAMHDDDLGPIGQVLKDYLTEWLGGEPLYSSDRGHPRLRQRHMHVPIGIAERDAWLLCMTWRLVNASATKRRVRRFSTSWCVWLTGCAISQIPDQPQHLRAKAPISPSVVAEAFRKGKNVQMWT